MTGKGRGRFLLALYILLTLMASTGVALQLYLMQVQNPGLRPDLCQAPGEAREVDHSPLCGLQVAPGLPPVPAPAPPTLAALLRERPSSLPGYGGSLPKSLFSRAPPPFAQA